METNDRLPLSRGSPGTIAPAKGRLDRRRLFRVLDYIDRHLEDDLTLDNLASVACLSRFHFARAFKQAVGQSPGRYVVARRLERAKALLVEGDTPLVEVALALRFSSQANFTRAFKQSTGLAPGQYRRGAMAVLDTNALRARRRFNEADLPHIPLGEGFDANLSNQLWAA